MKPEDSTQFLKHCKQPRTAFKEYMKQLAYEDAWGRHEELLESCCGQGNAYQAGYYSLSEWRKDGLNYPYWLAGHDRFKEEPPTPTREY